MAHDTAFHSSARSPDPVDIPAKEDMRLPTSPEALLARLEAWGIAARTHHHPPVHTVEESKALRGALPGGHCKNLFLKDKKGQLWLLVADEDTRIALNQVHQRLPGAGRLSFASAERLWAVLGVQPGSVTPFALINDQARQVRVALDTAMRRHAQVHYHPLRNDRSTAITLADLERFIRNCGHVPQWVDLDSDSILSDEACVIAPATSFNPQL